MLTSEVSSNRYICRKHNIVHFRNTIKIEYDDNNSKS